MPAHTRSQRRRQTAQQPPRQRIERTNSNADANQINDVTPFAEHPILQEVSIGTAARPALQAVPVGAAVRAEATRIADTRRASTNVVETRTSSARRRVRPALEPVDYASDYRSARRDLRWIAIWTVLLFAAMIALRLSGLV